MDNRNNVQSSKSIYFDTGVTVYWYSFNLVLNTEMSLPRLPSSNNKILREKKKGRKRTVKIQLVKVRWYFLNFHTLKSPPHVVNMATICIIFSHIILVVTAMSNFMFLADPILEILCTRTATDTNNLVTS